MNVVSMNNYITMQKDPLEKSTAIQVYVRVRPLVGAELGTEEVVEVEGDVYTILFRGRQSR